MLVELVETPPGVGRVVVAATPGTPGLDIPPVGSRGVRSPVSLFTKKSHLFRAGLLTLGQFAPATCSLQ